ncbi:MAG: VC0807 family protein [Porticoccaceae bacterium]
MNPSEPASAPTPTPAPARENMLLNIGFNILLPTLILMKLSGPEALGTTWALIVALLFPIAYGLRDFVVRRKFNFFSALGVVSVLLTGGISLLELDPRYLAIKEAAIPGIIGLAVLVSVKTRYPLIRTMLFNDTVLETEKINAELEQRAQQRAFDKRMSNSSYIVAASFFLSSCLNYILATNIVTASPGSVTYNEQLGMLTAWSYPVIAIPATIVMIGAMIYLFRGITQLTGLSFEDMIRQHHLPKDQQQEKETP